MATRPWTPYDPSSAGAGNLAFFPTMKYNPRRTNFRKPQLFVRSPRAVEPAGLRAAPFSNFEVSGAARRRPQTARARVGEPHAYFQTTKINLTARRTELEQQRADLAAATKRIEDELQKMPVSAEGPEVEDGGEAPRSIARAPARPSGASAAARPSARPPRPATSTRRTFGGRTFRPQTDKGEPLPPTEPVVAEPPQWLKYDRKVLRFYTYFKEPVHERGDEAYRTRKCNLLFYLEDGTLELQEPKQENSGVPQGTFLKRGVHLKAPGVPYTPQDLVVGQTVRLNNVEHFLLGCDAATRTFVAVEHGTKMPANMEPPADPFMDQYTKTVREYHQPLRSRQTDNKAILIGRPSLVPKRDTLKQHLECDRKVLRFVCLWDDSKKPYGERRKFRLDYYLADDTVEIGETFKRNGGRDEVPAFIRRRRLPRDYQDQSVELVHGRNTHKYIVQSDIRCGRWLNVFGRKLMIMDCDRFTKEYYLENLGIVQQPVMFPEAPEVMRKADIAPYNGWGSEEDSMASCIHVNPKRRIKMCTQFLKNRARQLRFEAKFSAPAAEDTARRFVITYYLEDDTISVFEKPQRNSGMVEGKFLQRGTYKRPGRARQGAKKRTMLQEKLYEKIQQKMTGGPGGLIRAFRHFGVKAGSNDLDLDIFRHGLLQVGLVLTEEESKELFDSYDADGSGNVNFDEFVVGVMDDTKGSFGTDAAATTARYYRCSDFHVGAKLRFLFPSNGYMTQGFEILSCDKFTRNLMEKEPALFPKDNVETMIQQLPQRLSKLQVNVGFAWKKADPSGKGWITAGEFKHVLAEWAVSLGFVDEDGLADDELDRLVEHYDVDDSGRFDRAEFLAAFKGDETFRLRALEAMARKSKVSSVEKQIAQMLRDSEGVELADLFDEIDADGNGRISFDEFHRFLISKGVRLTEEQEARIFFKYDADASGSISLKQFMCSAAPETAESKRHVRRLSSMGTGAAESTSMEAYRKRLEEAREAGKIRRYGAVVEEEQKRTNHVLVQLEPVMIAFVTAFSKRKLALRKNFHRYDTENCGLIDKSSFSKSIMAANDEFPKACLEWLELSLFPSEAGRDARLQYNRFLDTIFARDVAGLKRLISQAHWQVACIE